MSRVNETLKKIGLGLGLIAGASALLLYSDLGSRRGTGKQGAHAGPLKVAMVQQTSIPSLDDGVIGALAALKDRGYEDGGRMALRSYNAQGDIATANAIAKEVTSGDYDLVFSFSTISLQTIANANKFATPPRHHVFTLVTDPYAVGVGVSRENHLSHPPYMTGYGSLAPVEDLFRLALQLRPSLKRVGIVWNPAEANSVVTTSLGRKVCASMGITLVEANAENSTMVGEAMASLLSRNVEAIWVSPDLTTTHALDLVVRKARVAKIPVLSSLPTTFTSGTLFELGANYQAIGRAAGNLAADILDGRDPATIPVENIMPVSLHVDRTALKGLRDAWQLPEAVVERADVVVDATGRHVRAAAPAAAKPAEGERTGRP